MAAMTGHQIPANDSQGMPGEAATGPSPDEPTGTQDNSLQQLSDVYAELIDTDQPEPSPPNRPTTTPPPEPPPVIDNEDISAVSILEAILFVGHPENKPTMPRDVARVIRGVAETEVEQLVEQLNDCYQQLGAPYEINCIEGGYLMQLGQPAELLREKFYSKIKQRRLSQAAIDVLAIVAYNQGIKREEVDRLRDRSSGAVLSQLVRRKVLCIQQRDENSRSLRYFTSDRFLELFGLESIDDLPQTYDLEKSA